jgi:hypothetical protein
MEVMTKALKLVSLVALLTLTLIAHAQSPEQSRKSLSLGRLAGPLKNAGFTIDEPSLIRALKGEDKVIAATAALTLGKIGGGADVKKALFESISDPDPGLAVHSMFALWLLGDNGWTKTGIKRLPGLDDKIEQILLAGHLARAGKGDGWPFILAAIKKEKRAPFALETVPAFVGKRDSQGQVIDVVRDLENLEKELSPPVAAMVKESLKRLKKTPE